MSDKNKFSGTGNDIITSPSRLYVKKMDGVNSATENDTDGDDLNHKEAKETSEEEIDSGEIATQKDKKGEA